MKKTYLLLCCFILILSCKKKTNGCSPVPAQSESASIAAFCNANKINYIVDSNGIYYQILDPGAGARANGNSTITATYSTTLLSSEIIDTTHSITPVNLPLSQFIEGWRIAIPYIQEGGHIKMVIPSELAYGCIGIDKLVPPNAPLYYDVILKAVSP